MAIEIKTTDLDEIINYYRGKSPPELDRKYNVNKIIRGN